MQFISTFSVRLMALAVLVLLGACNKLKTPVGPTDPILSGISWTVDGQNITSTTASQTISNGTLVLTSVAKGSNGTDIYNLTISVPAATGTYDLGVAVPGKSYTASYQTYINGVSTTYTANSVSRTGMGTVTVSLIGVESVIGEFSFTGVTSASPSTSKAITNGKFSVKR